MKSITRHQLYNRLIDISFVLSVVAAVRVIGWDLGIFTTHLPQPIGTFYLLAFDINLVLSNFLIFAKFLRDEYSERIWRQSAQKFVLILFIILNTTVIMLLFFGVQFGRLITNDWVNPEMLKQIQAKDDKVQILVFGIMFAIWEFAQVASSIFIILFKWTMWRDSR